MQAPRSFPEPGAGASDTTGPRQAVGMPLPPARMQAPVATRPPPPPMPPILLSGNANAYPPIAGSLPAVPLERCDSLNSLLAKRQQAAASAFKPIPASSNMIAMLEAEDKQAGTPKKVRVTGSQTESDDDGTEFQDVAAGARSFGDNGGQDAAFKKSAVSLQLPGTVGVNPPALVPAPAPSTSITEPYVKRMPPRSLRRIGSKPIDILIAPGNKRWFDVGLMRVLYLPDKKYPVIRPFDVWRLAGFSEKHAERHSTLASLAILFQCREKDIPRFDFDGTVSARSKLVGGLNLYCSRNGAVYYATVILTVPY